MSELFNSITTFADAHQLIPDNSTIILGLSGGPDSLLLLHYLHWLAPQRSLKIVAAHLDHQWRANSQDDIKFCHDVTAGLDLRLVVGTASEIELTDKFNGSQEERGRLMRRQFLEQVKKEYDGDVIALGHHRQDQEETFFIRLIRGATLTGLCAMKPKDGGYIRPLLHTNKQEILEYLDSHDIKYLVDPSNVSEDYLRNRIRLNVIPALYAADPRFSHNFERTLHNLQETEQFLAQLTTQTFEAIAQQTASGWSLDIHKLTALDPFMQQRVIMHWLILEQVPFVPTQKFIHEILRFIAQKKSMTHQIHHEWMVRKDSGCLSIKIKKL